jgi:DNA-binding beta-propeller fold protein YncE
MSIEPIATEPLSVYPNPTKGVVYIHNANGAEVQVYNSNGVLLQSTRESQVDLSNYPAGVYLLRIDDKTLKVVKQ